MRQSFIERVELPVVSPDAAVVVFATWVEDFDVEHGEDYREPACDCGAQVGRDFRRPARFDFLTNANSSSGKYIYIAAAGSGPIKVGLSENPLRRMLALPGYTALVAIEHQTRGNERLLHRELENYRAWPRNRWGGYLGIKTEWFAPSVPLVSLAYRLANVAHRQIVEEISRRVA